VAVAWDDVPAEVLEAWAEGYQQMKQIQQLVENYD
jgi:hemoglobin-like flavoprotein